MNALYSELAERIRGEIPDLERVAQRALAAWAQAKQMPDESAYLDSVALNLHGFYSGLERLFELIARHVDGAFPSGETWHRDLLQQMTQDMAKVTDHPSGFTSSPAGTDASTWHYPGGD